MVDFNSEIENKILESIPGLEPESDSTTEPSKEVTTNVTTDTSKEQVSSTTKADDKAEADKGTKPNEAAKASTVDDGAKPDEQQSPNKGSNYSAGNGKDLIDPATGKIIARGGTERRLYEREALLSYHSTKNEVARLTSENKIMNDALVSTRVYGLTPEEVITGQKMIAGWKKDPAATLKFLLTEAQKKGINIEGVGNEATNAVLAELRGQNANKAATEPTKIDENAVYEQVTNELRGFFIKYPEAEQHQDLIAQIIDRDVAHAKANNKASTLTTEQAYLILTNECAKRGIDVSKPIVPQLNRTNGDNNANVVTNTTTQSKPLPNGKGNTGNNLVSTTDVKFADEDMSFKDIIAGAFNDVKQLNGGKINL